MNFDDLTWTCHEPTTLAYLAGYFDADGCVTVQLRRVASVTVSCRITSVNREMIDWFQSSFGGWVACQRQPRQNRREAFSWGLDHVSCIPFLEAVIPYLRLKRAEAEIALELQRSVSARHKTSGALTTGEVAERIAYRDRFAEAKSVR